MTDLDLPAAPPGFKPGAERLSAAAVIQALARRHGVVYAAMPHDVFAFDVSRLSDAGVTPDEIENLLQALTQAGAITHRERFALHAAYLRETTPG